MAYAFKIIQELRHHGMKTDLVSLAAALFKEADEFISLVQDGASTEDMLQYLGRCDERALEEAMLIVLDEDLGERHKDYGYSRRNPAMRKLLSIYGTDIRRAQDEDYWIKRMVATTHGSTDVGVFIDLRYPNEADWLLSNNGLSVRIDYEPKPVEGDYKYSAQGLEDVTETALDEYKDFYAHVSPWTFDRVSFGEEVHEILLQLNENQR